MRLVNAWLDIGLCSYSYGCFRPAVLCAGMGCMLLSGHKFDLKYSMLFFLRHYQRYYPFAS